MYVYVEQPCFNTIHVHILWHIHILSVYANIIMKQCARKIAKVLVDMLDGAKQEVIYSKYAIYEYTNE